MPKAFILGGTGQIGLACATHLKALGWQVTLAARTPCAAAAPFKTVNLDRNTPDALARALGDGADLLLDCIAFTAADAAQLVGVADSVGQIAAISSASVYCDAQGRTLDTAATKGFPDYPVPIHEDHPTVAPADTNYSSNKAAMEATLQAAPCPVTVLRPGAVHGPHSKHAREYWVLRRLLDGRATIPLAFNGASQFQTTATSAIARTLAWAYEAGGNRVVNVADDDAPNVLQIAETICATTGLAGHFRPHDGAAPGRTPWSTGHPIVLASSAPPCGTYAETVGPALDWLRRAVTPQTWRQVLPDLAAYPRDHFDYAEEDAFLSQAG